MLGLILNMANEDNRVRAVIMNGSRVNPNAPCDFFQDYDIVFIVTDVSCFVHDRSWIDRFGELMIMQTPDDMGESSSPHNCKYTYLMQFNDGNRIDLTFYSIEKMDSLEEDSLSLLLMDKDGIIDSFPPPSDKSYLPKPPTSKQFDDCCNEFWWVCPYVAKGLWREELSYAKHMLDGPVRDMLMKMLTWHIGIRTNFTKSPGKLGKYFKKYLEPEIWEMFVDTYSDAYYEYIWQALFTMCELFRTISISVAEHYSYEYPYRDDEMVTAHLKHVKKLPKDAKEMYK